MTLFTILVTMIPILAFILTILVTLLTFLMIIMAILVTNLAILAIFMTILGTMLTILAIFPDIPDTLPTPLNIPKTPTKYQFPNFYRSRVRQVSPDWPEIGQRLATRRQVCSL